MLKKRPKGKKAGRLWDKEKIAVEQGRSTQHAEQRNAAAARAVEDGSAWQQAAEALAAKKERAAKRQAKADERVFKKSLKQDAARDSVAQAGASKDVRAALADVGAALANIAAGV